MDLTTDQIQLKKKLERAEKTSSWNNRDKRINQKQLIQDKRDIEKRSNIKITRSS